MPLSPVPPPYQFFDTQPSLDLDLAILDGAPGDIALTRQMLPSIELSRLSY